MPANFQHGASETLTLYARGEMEGIDALDLLNTAIAAFAILGGMVYAIIKTKVDVEHLTKKVETLFNLFNNMRDKDK